jgi:hypothetical protein
MRHHIRGILSMMVAVGRIFAASVASASARMSGRESFKGVIVTSGESGTRTAVSTLFVAWGAFKGVGRVVEVQNRPGDADNVSRDDLVFRQGRIHIVTSNGTPSMSFDPQTCAFKGRVPQTGKIQGGTGRFRHASGSLVGAGRARGVAAREADGSCSQQQAPLLEVDIVSARTHVDLSCAPRRERCAARTARLVEEKRRRSPTSGRLIRGRRASRQDARMEHQPRRNHVVQVVEVRNI